MGPKCAGRRVRPRERVDFSSLRQEPGAFEHGLERKDPPALADTPAQRERRDAVMRPDVDPGLAGTDVIFDPTTQLLFGDAEYGSWVTVPRRVDAHAPERAAEYPVRARSTGQKRPQELHAQRPFPRSSLAPATSASTPVMIVG